MESDGQIESDEIEESSEITSESVKLKPKNLLAIIKQWFCGVMDALWVPHMINVLSKSEKVQFAIYDVILYNGFICFSTIWFFRYYVEPLMAGMFITEKYDSFVTQKIALVCYFIFVGSYYILWIIPVFLLSFLINGKWLQIVSQKSFLILNNHLPKGASLKSLGQLPKAVAAEVYTSTFYVMFVFQCTLCTFIPFFGPLVNFVLLCWMYSLYCFEYKWSHWHIGRRLKYIEDNWPYFFGFGMVTATPFTVASVYGGFWLSYAIWWLLFPYFIVMAIAAKKPPQELTNKEGKTSVALFRFAKYLNSLILSFAVSFIKYVTSSR